MKTLVLGLGNELFGDDGIGIHIIRKLKKEKDDLFSNIDLIESSISGLALLDVIAEYDRLIVIDIIKKIKPQTGKIRVFDLHELRHVPGPSPHYVSFPQIITLGKKWGLKMPSLIKIIAIEAKNIYKLGEELSPEIKDVIPKVIEKVREILYYWERND